MQQSATYGATRDRVEAYFDRTATAAWARLTSDAPVSGIRQTVREGRDAMRAVMLSRLPEDLTGLRILDAGCGTGAMTEVLALRGAKVVAADISPHLIEIARRRVPGDLHPQITFAAGDMLDPVHGRFDHVIAMDSMIYYARPDLIAALSALAPRVDGSIVFTLPPRTPLLSLMFGLGKLFPRADRSPRMVPHAIGSLTQDQSLLSQFGSVKAVERVSRGFYISTCLEARP